MQILAPSPLKILNIFPCVAIFILFEGLSSSVTLTKLTLLLHNQIQVNQNKRTRIIKIQLEQVNTLLNSYPPNKSNALNQDITKFVINFLKKSGCFNQPLNSLNQRSYVLLFFFLPICFLYVFFLFVCFVYFLFVCLVVVFLLENKCKFAAYNSCITTILLINSSLTSSILICDQL